MKKEIVEGEKKYGYLSVPAEVDLSKFEGQAILIKDSLGTIEAKVHNNHKRIDRLTEWHKDRETKIGEKIMIQFDENEIEDKTPIIHIKFLNERETLSNPPENNDFPFKDEKEFEKYIKKHLNELEEGLKLEEVKGREYLNLNNKIDILCTDKNRNYVVVELKVKRTTDYVVGQVSRYMGYIRQEWNHVTVRGIIVTPEYNKNLEYAVSNVPNVTIKYFKINVEFTDPEKKKK